MTDPLPVGEALRRILARCRRLSAEPAALADSPGRVLAQDVVADIDLPPFTNSAMDGYAVRADDLATADPTTPVRLPVVAAIYAAPGEPAALERGTAARVMTGGPLPPGADAVVPQEQVDASDDRATFTTTPRLGANVRARGSDLRRGETVVPAGTTLGHVDLALLAAVGAVEVRVARRPRVAVLATGDELVDPAQSPGPGQIRDSGSLALPAQLIAAGAEVVAAERVGDDAGAFGRRLDALRGVDLIVTMGGVSVGERDYVRPVFAERGEVDFWRVAVKPGKPLLFGALGDALFFGLPGNPVSAMVTLDVFVKPAIDALLGRRDGGRLSLRGRWAADVNSDPQRAEYVRVVARPDDSGAWEARPTGDQSSGRMTSMRGANAYAIIPVGVSRASVGEPVMLEIYDVNWGVGRE